jgi:hypothetical protein
MTWPARPGAPAMADLASKHATALYASCRSELLFQF